MDTDILEQFESSILKSPEVFIEPSNVIVEQITSFTKVLFDYAKTLEPNGLSPLQELYTDGFEAEQIYEQIKMQNIPLTKYFKKEIKKITEHPEDIKIFITENQNNENVLEENDKIEESENEIEEDENEDIEEDDDEDIEEDDEDIEDDSDDENSKFENEDHEEQIDDQEDKMTKRKSTKKLSRDVCEDGFFNWDDMEKEAEMDEHSDEEDKEDNDEEESDEDDDEEDDNDDMNDVKNLRYEDFFGKSKSKKSKEDDDEEEEEDMDDEKVDEDDIGDNEVSNQGEKKRLRKLFDEEQEENDEDLEIDEELMAERGIQSKFEKQQFKIQQRIQKYEEEAIGEKSWELRGEIQASKRPENSLLEAQLDYERPTKVAPTITPEITSSLEELIKQRIRDDQYDDVLRKLAPTEQAKQEHELSQEKSKQGLSEIYENDYMKNALGFEENDESKKEQEEIQTLFDRLMWKLNALSNFHYTPKPVVKEMQIKPSVPAIAMEEVVPMGVSDANLRAPEEVYDKKHGRNGVVQVDGELSKEERNAKRLAKKNARRKSRKQKEADERLVAKINPGLGNKYEKKKLMESLHNSKIVTKGKEMEGSTTKYSKSSTFFKTLQEDVSKSIHSNIQSSSISSSSNTKSSAAYKL